MSDTAIVVLVWYVIVAAFVGHGMFNGRPGEGEEAFAVTVLWPVFLLRSIVRGAYRAWRNW